MLKLQSIAEYTIITLDFGSGKTLCDRAAQRSAVLNTVSSLCDNTVYTSPIAAYVNVVFLAKLEQPSITHVCVDPKTQKELLWPDSDQ